MSLIGLLLLVIVICVIIWATKALTSAFGVGEPIATVLLVLVVLVCLVYLASHLGFTGRLGLGF